MCESVCERERDSVCACERECGRERVRKRESVRVRERESGVCERDRARERV